MYYEIDIAGKKRNLQLYEVGENTDIAAFILFGDVEITQHAAAKLLEKAPDFDIMLTAEAKSIPLIYEMARQAVALCLWTFGTGFAFTVCRQFHCTWIQHVRWSH